MESSGRAYVNDILRLRQAACHPGLIDKSKTGEPSKKIDTLLAQLGQVHDEGHKALVFSQFTSLLAIVRSRIGQTRQVFTYRLIARDTVEEKALELQKTKRDLAEAIITADNSVMRNLTREDLELLLS